MALLHAATFSSSRKTLGVSEFALLSRHWDSVPDTCKVILSRPCQLAPLQKQSGLGKDTGKSAEETKRREDQQTGIDPSMIRLQLCIELADSPVNTHENSTSWVQSPSKHTRIS